MGRALRNIRSIMLVIDEHLFVGRGTLRACYLHPEREDLIIKVPLQHSSGGEVANRLEMKSYLQLRRIHGQLDHISHCHGFIETDRGAGLTCDCIRDHDQSISKTIWDIVVYQEACDIDYLLEVAADFCNYLIAGDIFLFDINLKNVVLQRMEDDSYRAFAVDLKGPLDNKEFLQLSSRIRFLGRKKLKRRTNQLLERIVQFREQRESLKAKDR